MQLRTQCKKREAPEKIQIRGKAEVCTDWHTQLTLQETVRSVSPIRSSSKSDGTEPGQLHERAKRPSVKKKRTPKRVQQQSAFPQTKSCGDLPDLTDIELPPAPPIPSVTDQDDRNRRKGKAKTPPARTSGLSSPPSNPSSSISPEGTPVGMSPRTHEEPRRRKSNDRKESAILSDNPSPGAIRARNKSQGASGLRSNSLLVSSSSKLRKSGLTDEQIAVFHEQARLIDEAIARKRSNSDLQSNIVKSNPENRQAWVRYVFILGVIFRAGSF
jgi:hypothetical protein